MLGEHEEECNQCEEHRGHEEHEGEWRQNETRGSSSSAFSVSLPAELTIPLYFPLVWIPPNLQACLSLSVQDSLQCLGSL